MRRFTMAVGALAVLTLLGYLAVRPVRPVVAGPVTITWEAESAQAVEEPFRVREARRLDKRPRPQANSGTGYIEIPDKANGNSREGDGSTLPGVARYRVRVPEAGAYKLWARVLWPNGCGNSFWVAKQGRPKQLLGEDGTYDAWQWQMLQGQPLALARGVNVIEVTNREDGVIMDQLQVTTAATVPTGPVRPTPNALE